MVWTSVPWHGPWVRGVVPVARTSCSVVQDYFVYELYSVVDRHIL